MAIRDSSNFFMGLNIDLNGKLIPLKEVNVLKYNSLTPHLFPAKISRDLSPKFCLPFNNLIRVFIFFQPGDRTIY